MAKARTGFLISKQFDITLTDFKQIDEIIKHIDTKGINTMRIGELENKDMLAYHQKGKTEALKAAQRKATYLVEALGKRLGNVIRIVEKIAVMLFRLRKAMSYHPMLPHSTISAPSRRTIPCWCVLKLLISKLRTKLHIKNEIAGVRRFSFHHSGFTSFMAYPAYQLPFSTARLAH